MAIPALTRIRLAALVAAAAYAVRSLAIFVNGDFPVLLAEWWGWFYAAGSVAMVAAVVASLRPGGHNHPFVFLACVVVVVSVARTASAVGSSNIGAWSAWLTSMNFVTDLAMAVWWWPWVPDLRSDT